MDASCRPTGAMPSTVRISWPSACTASIRQERAEGHPAEWCRRRTRHARSRDACRSAPVLAHKIRQREADLHRFVIVLAVDGDGDLRLSLMRRPTRPMAATSSARATSPLPDAGDRMRRHAHPRWRSPCGIPRRDREQILPTVLSPTSAFHLVRAHRRHRHTTKRKRARVILPLASILDQHRRRGDGEIAMPAGEFDEAITMPCRPAREGGEVTFIGLDRRRHVAGGKFRERRYARPVWAGDRDTLASTAAATEYQFRGRIEMAERAADSAAIARLAVADVLDRLMHQRTALAFTTSENSISRCRVMAPISSALPSGACRIGLDADSDR